MTTAAPDLLDRLTAEGLIPFSEAAKVPTPTGGRVTRLTIHRWYSRGVRVPGGRVYLEVARVNGRLLTSRPALRRFFAAQLKLERGREAHPPADRPPADRPPADRPAWVDDLFARLAALERAAGLPGH